MTIHIQTKSPVEEMICLNPYGSYIEYKRKIKVKRGSPFADFLWEHPEYEDEVEYVD